MRSSLMSSRKCLSRCPARKLAAYSGRGRAVQVCLVLRSFFFATDLKPGLGDRCLGGGGGIWDRRDRRRNLSRRRNERRKSVTGGD